MKTPKESLFPTKIDDIQDFPTLREFLKALIEQMEEEHTGLYEDLKTGKDADKVDGLHAADLKHGISADEDTAIKVKIGSFTCPGSTGNYSVTGVGFKPRYVEFMVGKYSTTDCYYSIGWMDYNGNQRMIGGAIAGAATTLFKTNTGTGVITIPTPGDSYYVGATYVSMNNDGFTINFATVNTGFTISWKATR